MQPSKTFYKTLIVEFRREGFRCVKQYVGIRNPQIFPQQITSLGIVFQLSVSSRFLILFSPSLLISSFSCLSSFLLFFPPFSFPVFPILTFPHHLSFPLLSSLFFSSLSSYLFLILAFNSPIYSTSPLSVSFPLSSPSIIGTLYHPHVKQSWVIFYDD